MGVSGPLQNPLYRQRFKECWNDTIKYPTRAHLAKELEISLGTLDRHLQILKCEGEELINRSRKRSFPKIDTIAQELSDTVREGIDEIPAPEVIHGDIVFVISDIHVPFHSVYWLTRLCELALKRRKQFPDAKVVLAINGDFLDLQMLSDFGAGKDAVMRSSMIETAQVLDAIGPLFDEIAWNPGNHEDRFARKMERQLGFSALAKIIKTDVKNMAWDDIKIISHNYTVINDSWQCIHAKRYSKIQTKTAVSLAERWRINTIQGHEHHPPGFARSACGEYFGVMNGHMTDTKKQAYIQLNRDLFPHWENGFVELYKGSDGITRFKLYSEKLTDWGEVLYDQKRETEG